MNRTKKTLLTTAGLAALTLTAVAIAVTATLTVMGLPPRKTPWC